MIGDTAFDVIEKHVARGDSFPVPAEMLAPEALAGVRVPQTGMWVKPPKSALGKRLSVGRLLGEFRKCLAWVFPKG